MTLAAMIGGDCISTMSLVDVDFASRAEVMEPLLGVDFALVGGCPGRSVDCDADVVRVCTRTPVDQQGNGVLKV